MSPRHYPESFFAPRDDDGTDYRDPADLAYELDRDDSDACAMYAAGDDE